VDQLRQIKTRHPKYGSIGSFDAAGALAVRKDFQDSNRSPFMGIRDASEIAAESLV
jgi:hypothetical protein